MKLNEKKILTFIKKKLVTPGFKMHFEKDTTILHNKDKKLQLFFDTSELVKKLLSVKNINHNKITASVENDSMIINYKEINTKINSLGSNHFLTQKQVWF